MNGIPVYPRPKNGERPYLAVSVPSFSDPFFGPFWRFRGYVGGGRWICYLCRTPINTPTALTPTSFQHSTTV